MKYKSLSTYQGTIEYIAKEDCVEITGYRGRDVKLTVPDIIDDLPVSRIKKKAFLSSKTLRELKIPYTVTAVDDFAFAFCSNLKTIYVSEKLTEIGLTIFKDCESLEAIYVTRVRGTGGYEPKETTRGTGGCDPQGRVRGTGGYEPQGTTGGTGGYDAKAENDLAHLLAATIGILEAPFLLTPSEVYLEEWLEKWDKRMMNAMNTDDMEGYSKLLLCGEEDYGTDENKPEVYKSNRIKAKVRLCMLRLINNYGLSCNDEDYLVKYLQQHKKGEKSEETWQVVLNEHGDDRTYYDLLMRLDCVNNTNLPDMLIDMKESHAEMKAYLLKQGEESKSENDFFDDLEL